MKSFLQIQFSNAKAYWLAYAIITGVVTIVAVIGSAWAIEHDSAALALLFAAPFGLLALAAGRRFLEFHAYRHIPGPKPSFFIGNLRSLLAEEHGGRDQALLELHRLHGPVVRLHLAWGSTPFVSMSKVSDNLGRPDTDSNRRADGDVLPNSLMGLKRGEQHSRHRRELNAVFTPSAIRSGAPRIDAVSRLYLASWRDGDTRHGSLKSDLHHWSAHALAAYLCGDDWEPGGDLTEYLAAIAALEETISIDAFHPWFSKWISPLRRARARKAYRYLFDLFSEKIEGRRRRGGDHGKDALGRLTGMLGQWSHAECVEEMISLVAGGTDAMSYTTAQSLVLLSRSPRVLDELREELADSNDSLPLASVINVISEAMRLFPAVPFSSKVVPEGGIVEEGLAIPAGTNLMWMKTAVGLDPKQFHEPHQFKPSRFSGPSEHRESMASALPFGAGPRQCPGRSLAHYHCGSLLASIISNFEIEPIELVDVTFSATVSVTPSAVPVRLVPRKEQRLHSKSRAAAQRPAGRCPFGHDAVGTMSSRTA